MYLMLEFLTIHAERDTIVFETVDYISTGAIPEMGPREGVVPSTLHFDTIPQLSFWVYADK